MRLPMILVCLAVAGHASAAHARPVSYAGGWMVMQSNDADSHALEVDYSPTSRYALGYLGEYWRDKDWQFHGVQANWLAKRWNMPASQANIFAKAAMGAAYSDAGGWDGKHEPAGSLSISADWEDRRFYASYESRYVEAGDIDHFFMQKARVGIAPYIGDYGDLHTWLMLEVSHNPTRPDAVTLTPMIRMFKGDYLAELGINDNGDVLFNWTVQF